MESAVLEKAHDEYRRALTSAIDSTLPDETRDAAAKAAYESRKALDEAVIALAKAREEDEARAKFEAEHRVDPLVAEHEAREAFRKAILAQLDGRQGLITVPRPEFRTDYPLTTDTGDTTDYAFYNIKTQLWNEIEKHENAESAIKRAGVKVIRTPGDQPIDIPVLTTDAVADTAPGSEVTAPTNAMYPVFGKTTLNSYRVQGFMTVSEEMLRTPDYPFYDVLADVAARALAVQEATFLARGTGSSQPKGLGACGTSAVTAASTSTFTDGELISCYFGPVEGVRQRGEWFLSSYAMIELFKLKDGEGHPLLQPSPAAGLPDTLFGKPLHEEAYLVGSTISTGEKHVFFGDPAKFWVRYAGGVDIGASRDMRFNEWEVVIRAALWMDCDMPDATGFYYITQA